MIIHPKWRSFISTHHHWWLAYCCWLWSL